MFGTKPYLMRTLDRQLVSERVTPEKIAELQGLATESLLERLFHPDHSSKAKHAIYALLIKRGINVNEVSWKPSIEKITVPGFLDSRSFSTKFVERMFVLARWMVVIAVVSGFGGVVLQDQWNAAALRDKQVLASLVRLNRAEISRCIHQWADKKIDSLSEFDFVGDKL